MDLFFLADGDASRSLEREDTLPERSSDITDRLALWELSDRSLQAPRETKSESLFIVYSTTVLTDLFKRLLFSVGLVICLFNEAARSLYSLEWSWTKHGSQPLYLRFSFFSLCFSTSLPLSFPSLGGFSSHFSLFLCFPLCFFPPAAMTGFTSGSTGGGGLGVRGPFFFPWPPLEDLAVADAEDDTEVFFSFFLEPEALGPLVCLGDPLDFLEEGEPLELERSGDVWNYNGE